MTYRHSPAAFVIDTDGDNGVQSKRGSVKLREIIELLNTMLKRAAGNLHFITSINMW